MFSFSSIREKGQIKGQFLVVVLAAIAMITALSLALPHAAAFASDEGVQVAKGTMTITMQSSSDDGTSPSGGGCF